MWTKAEVKIIATGKIVLVTFGETKVWDRKGNEWLYSEIEDIA